MKPVKPAMNDEISMDIFEETTISCSVKASKVIKVDIVKPIPARKATPNIFL